MQEIQEFADRMNSARASLCPVGGTVVETVVDTRAGSGAEFTVDVHIRRLRMKLGHEIVSTMHGVGYRLDDRARVTVEHEAGQARRAG